MLELGQQWRKVSAAVQTRTPQQCRERYANVVNPELAQSPCTESEQQAIRAACEAHTKAHGRIVWKQVCCMIRVGRGPKGEPSMG